MSDAPESPLPRPRVLVTGSTGFIGRRLVRRLLAEFGVDNVVGFSRRPVSPLESDALEFQRSLGMRTIVGDLVNSPATVEPPPPAEIIFHLAANIDTDAPDADLRVNDVGTSHLLDWLKPILPGARIVYTSSVAVHDRDREPQGPIAETSPFVARTPYGRTKLAGEQVLRNRAAADGFSWTVVRLPTVYGPGQKVDGLFDKLIGMARTGALPGRIDWPGRTSIVYVDDLADAMLALAQAATAANEVYCVASDDDVTVGQLAGRIARVVGKPAGRIAVPAPLLWLMRRAVWSRTLAALMPKPARLSFWRLSLIVSDGFWFDARKFRAAFPGRLRTLEEGMRDLLSEQGRTPPRQRRSGRVAHRR